MHYVIDVRGERLGRIASRIAGILQGKLTPGYAPRFAGEDTVLVKNVSKIVVTGGKPSEKVYYRHTGYMGHLRRKPFKTLFERAPEEVLRRAVYNMLPKNKLRSSRLKHLMIEL